MISESADTATESTELDHSEVSPIPEDFSDTGLTDDERVSREDEELGGEPRVTPGPADADRLKGSAFDRSRS